MYNMYYENGVLITPNVVAEGDNATVTYRGILYNSGADRVIMHVGYGNTWEHATDIQMNKTADGFEAALQVKNNDGLHLAFRDSANHWDNNSGQNYQFEVQDRHIRNQ